MSKDIVAGFDVRKDYEGEKDFDSTYKDVELKKRLVPLGPADENGEIPYSEEVIEVVHESLIKDVLASQADSCGLEAYMRPYRLAGQQPPDVNVTDEVQDFTIFDNGMDLRASGSVEKLFQSLPADLREKYGSPEKLLREFSESALNEYIQKLIAAQVKKSEEKVEEEK